MLGYFFPGLFAMLALLAAPRRRPLWQWLVLGSALAQGLIFVIWHSVHLERRRRRQPLFLRRLRRDAVPAAADRVDRRGAWSPWAIGGLFVAPMVLNPFVASFQPDENAKRGPLRLLPVELTLLNDLPVWTEADRARVVVRRQQRPEIRVSWSRSSTTTPTAGKRTRASGRAAIRAPTSSSRPTSRSAGPCS